MGNITELPGSPAYHFFLQRCGPLRLASPWHFLDPHPDCVAPVVHASEMLTALRSQFSAEQLEQAGLVTRTSRGDLQLRPALCNPTGAIVGFRQACNWWPHGLLTARGYVSPDGRLIRAAFGDYRLARGILETRMLFAPCRIHEVVLLQQLGLPAVLCPAFHRMTVDQLSALDQVFGGSDYELPSLPASAPRTIPSVEPMPQGTGPQPPAPGSTASAPGGQPPKPAGAPAVAPPKTEPHMGRPLAKATPVSAATPPGQGMKPLQDKSGNDPRTTSAAPAGAHRVPGSIPTPKPASTGMGSAPGVSEPPENTSAAGKPKLTAVPVSETPSTAVQVSVVAGLSENVPQPLLSKSGRTPPTALVVPVPPPMPDWEDVSRLKPTLVLLAWEPLAMNDRPSSLLRRAAAHLATVRQHLGTLFAGVMVWRPTPQHLDNLRFRVQRKDMALVREILLESTSELHDFEMFAHSDDPQTSQAEISFMKARANLVEQLADPRLCGSIAGQIRSAARIYEAAVEQDLVGPMREWALGHNDPIVRSAGVQLAEVGRLLHMASPRVQAMLRLEVEQPLASDRGLFPPVTYAQYLELIRRFGTLMGDLRRFRKYL